ncbi:MAG: hypothetical protein ACRYFX_15365 [Janthinobacterium lividum]
MPHSYPTRFFASFERRLGLLLGGTGLLAAALLLTGARPTGSGVEVAWEIAGNAPSPRFNQHQPKLADSAFIPFASVTSASQLRYVFADTCLPQGPLGMLPGSVSYRLAVRGPVAAQAPAAQKVSAIRRSWRTIKMMFR